jgi:hypothetical protein
LTNITGVMLEVLPDESLPDSGRAGTSDGNFVLSELELKWAAGTNAPDMSAKFADARADYSQSDFPVKQAIDGKVESGRNGWAIAGAPNIQRHTATFKLEQPIASTNGVELRFVLSSIMARIFCWVGSGSTSPPATIRWTSACPSNVVQAARAPAGRAQAGAGVGHS